MKRRSGFLLVLIVFSLSFKSLADEIADKTDGSFVGENPPKPVNSSFIGDIQNSIVNDSFIGGEDVKKHTDKGFVGDSSLQAPNTYFAGSSYQQQVKNSTVVPFAEEKSETVKDGVFIGEDVQKKTDGSFAGSNYGK